MAYEVNDGRIDTWALEAHVVDHCNLRCAECCTLSPHLPARTTTVTALAQDLTRAAQVLRPQVFKLTGGEPLLHPDIIGCLEVARAAGIARVISITTNGTFAARQPPRFWELLDRLTLSRYESAPLPEKSLAAIRDRCAEHDVRLTEKAYLGFQRMTPDTVPQSPEAARAIHAQCWLRVRCHLVHEGRFYMCTRPPHLRTVHQLENDDDGVGLDEADLRARLAAYLDRDAPLASCRFCLGASGARETHRQLTPMRVRKNVTAENS